MDALSLLGKCSNTLRLPMVPATEKAQAAVREANQSGALIVCGIQPSYPATGFGYIEAGEMSAEVRQTPIYRVRRFVEKHRLTKFRLNPHFPMNTLMLMRGLVAAQELGVTSAYLEAGLVAMWEDGLKMDDPAVIGEVVASAGLDGERLFALAQDQRIKDRLAANTQGAVERGAFGIPTFFVGDEMFFGKERLGQIEDMLTA